jgi:hypothetical protein
MSRGNDKPARKNPEWTPERAQGLADWVEAVFELFKSRKGWSRSKVIEKSGVSRSAVYHWKDTSENGQFPEPPVLDRFCSNLYQELASPLLDPSVPNGILGRGKPAALAGARVDALVAQTPTALEGKIRRVKMILKGRSLSPAQRERYEGMLGDFESAYERVIDTIIADLEPRMEADQPPRDE